MSIAHTDIVQISRRYATAIFALALEAKNEATVVSEFATLGKAISENKNLSEALANPTVSNAQKTAVLDGLMKKAGDATKKAVHAIGEAGRASMLPVVADQLVEMLAKHKGELEAVVTSARPLSAATKQQLSQSLQKATGKPVQMILQEDPALLGGLSIQLGSLRLDATLAGALSTMREQLLDSTTN